MRKCNSCGIQINEEANFCPACGSSDFTEIIDSAEEANVQQVQAAEEPVQEDKGNGNIVAGFFGALLFSLLGGLLYFAIYQIGFIAGICGLVIFLLAGFGYRLFAKTKNKNSIACLVISIIVMIVVIFLSECFCASYELYEALNAEGFDITLAEAIEVTPEFLETPELSEAFASDLAFAYIFGFVACIGNIISIVKARKQQQ